MELFATPDVSLLLNKVSRFFTGKGIRSYLVGGFVRDLFLERNTADIDIAIDGDASAAATELAACLEGKYVLLDEANGIARIVLPVENSSAGSALVLDCSTLRGTIEEDLSLRDFTVDAMAFELEVGNDFSLSHLIDPCGGYQDVRQRVIRAVSDGIFPADAARLLRAVRLAAELKFSVDPETRALIRRDAHLIAGVAGERVRDEVLRLLAARQAGRHLAYMDELGLLTRTIPELAPEKGVSQPFIHFWDVFNHSLETVSAVEFLLRQREWQYAGKEVLELVPWSETIRQYFGEEVNHGSTRGSLLKVAALLHDIAKPQTKSLDADGRARFLGHPDAGAAIASAILGRLRFSTREIGMVATMVLHHLRPSQMSQAELPSPRAVHRYFRDLGEVALATLFLNLADHLATRGPTLDMAHWRYHTGIIAHVLAEHAREESIIKAPRLVDGNDMMDILGLSPGPDIGRLLEAVLEAQAAGEITTREEALQLCKKILTHPEEMSLNNLCRGNHD
ncbi:MAG: HD domain-containing protein [Dehalococcoidales bacterium]|nr:HD domain-containing protein [Dehalococcoidales bacterium]